MNQQVENNKSKDEAIMEGKTPAQLEKRIKELEALISRKGVGSSYVRKVQRIQRDLNIALMLGTATAIVGLAAWALLSSNKE